MITDHHAVLMRVSDVTAAQQPDMADTESVEIQHDRLGVEEVRQLTVRAYNRPAEARTQLLVVRTLFITHEAQNALLKLLEEPPETTRFLFFVPLDFQLLPTLTSRLIIETEKSSDDNKIFDHFLTSAIADRLSMIEAAAKNKDTNWMRSIKQGLLHYKTTSENIAEVEAVELAARLLMTRGASNKMLLEHVALQVPRVGS